MAPILVSPTSGVNVVMRRGLTPPGPAVLFPAGSGPWSSPGSAPMEERLSAMRRRRPHLPARSGRFGVAAGLILLAAAAPARAQGMAATDREPTATSASDPLHGDFARQQLRHPRVLQARINARYGIKKLYREAGLPYPAAEIFIRVFKRERVLELWARPRETNRFLLLKSYPVCALAGSIGPKRRFGDGQTPEGFYEIDEFNAASEYLLSLHLDYPNASDRLFSGRHAPGGSIFIHGGCRTAGCIAVNDEAIEELYWIAVEARSGGQPRIPVHIFPARLTDEELDRLALTFRARPDLIAFWRNLQPGYAFFERTRTLPALSVDARGRYSLPASSPNGNTGAEGSLSRR